MKTRPQKDPLLFYLTVSGLLLTSLSLATWVGRPGPTIGTSTQSESMRALASIQQSSAPDSNMSSMELVSLSLNCSQLPETIHVAQHQHQVQFMFHDCTAPETTLEVMGSSYPEPLILFLAEREGVIDSEIVQLKEGVNTFTLEWLDQSGSLRSVDLNVHRG